MNYKRIVALFFSLALAVTAFAGSKYPEISHDELKQAIASGKVVLLDVNGTESYKSGHIPGAIDFTAHQKDLASVLPADKDALIVAYCGNEHCGAYARGAKAAEDLGFKNVKHYKPGIAGWKKAGEPVEKSS